MPPESSRICAHCAQSFKPERSSIRYCSTRCAGLAKRTLPEPEPRPCRCCGKTFTPPRKYPKRAYCSASCQRRACLKYDDSDTQTRRGREGAAKSRATQLDRGNGKTYRKHFGKHEHRVVAEQILGRPLAPGEVVHHIDGDKRNNDPSNLQVLASQAEHARLHATERRRTKEVSP